VITQESQVVTEISQDGVCDSECANLITPPSIYIQPSFLGGGDQDLSQDSEVQELLQALPFAESIEDFASIVEGSSLEAVGDAIALQDAQPRRIQLQGWLETLNQPVEEAKQTRSWQWSELPAVKSVLRWIDRSEQVRLLAIDASGLCQVRSLLSGLIVNTHASQLIPVSFG
jgi:hypothetical protein